MTDAELGTEQLRVADVDDVRSGAETAREHRQVSDHTTDLDDLILACLNKDPGRRPASAAALLEALEQCRVEGTWTQKDARSWWDETASQRSPADGSSQDASGSLPSDWQAALRTR